MRPDSSVLHRLGNSMGTDIVAGRVAPCARSGARVDFRASDDAPWNASA